MHHLDFEGINSREDYHGLEWIHSDLSQVFTYGVRRRFLALLQINPMVFVA